MQPSHKLLEPNKIDFEELGFSSLDRVVISIGSNLGDPEANLKRSLDFLQSDVLKDIKYSVVLATEAIVPLGAIDSWRKPFLNMVVSGQTNLSAEELLIKLKGIETKMGRPAQYEKWAPRIIDLDILLFYDQRIDTSTLTVPHSELRNRGFLLYLLGLLK